MGVAGVRGLAGGVPPTLATGADGTKGFAVGFRVNSLALGFNLDLDASATFATNLCCRQPHPRATDSKFFLGSVKRIATKATGFVWRRNFKKLRPFNNL